MPFDLETYAPGDAWETTEFATRALTPPRLLVTGAGVAATTTPSYFEFRSLHAADEGEIELIVNGSGSFNVVLERSFDDGTTWYTVETFTANTQKLISYAYLYKLRLRVVSGTDITIGLLQMV